MKNNYTFWELIDFSSIEIPIIQRDYAQGRKNRKIDEIRKSFVGQLKDALLFGKTMHLNFVYGKLHGIANEEKQRANRFALQNMVDAIRIYTKNLELNVDVFCEEKYTVIKDGNEKKNITFIPLDGQQRLTTLYLLHWYILTRLRDTEKKKQLSNFTYLIRPSSKGFCDTLVNENVSFDINTPLLSKKLIDAVWFHTYWKKDPTVNGMLIMLDEIHDQFRSEVDFNSIWCGLTEKRLINFDFLNLDDYNLTDDLYVKMNARGLSLSTFENFKSWLIEYVEDKENENDAFKILDINWKKSFDKEWADLFWDNKDEDNFLIDEEYMRFIRNIFQIFYVRENDIKDSSLAKTEEEKTVRENVILLATTKNKDGEFKDEYIYIPNDKFVELQVLTDLNLNEMFEILNLLVKYSNSKLNNSERLKDLNFQSEKSYFKAFITGQMSYSEKAHFYAFIRFLQFNKDVEDLSEDNLISWMRVCRNLILNSTIDDRANFSRVIKGIDLLAENCDGIINYIADYTSANFNGFSEYQSKEEIEKAKLIRINNDFEKIFMKYENHELFKGSVSFLLKTANEDNGINKTLSYLPIIYLLFKNDGSKYEYLLIRAILTNCSVNERIRLLNNAAKWRDLLRKEAVQDALIKTVEIIYNQSVGNFNEESIELILNDIISNYHDKTVLWKYYLIKNDVLLYSNASSSKIIKNDGNYFYLFNNENANWINNDYQILLSNFRNELITLLLSKSTDFKLNEERVNDWWVKTDISTLKKFYRGRHIWVNKEIQKSNFSLQFKENELIAGFRNSEKENIEIKDNDYEIINGWLLAKNLGQYPNHEDLFEDWITTILVEIRKLEEFTLNKVTAL